MAVLCKRGEGETETELTAMEKWLLKRRRMKMGEFFLCWLSH